MKCLFLIKCRVVGVEPFQKLRMGKSPHPLKTLKC